MALTKTHNRMIAGSAANAIDFGLSISASGAANSSAINNALASYDHVIIPSGSYDVDQMITVSKRKTLELSTNTLISRPATSTETNPVVWLNENNGALIGSTNSRVRCLVAPENGVVRIGSDSMSSDTNDALKNLVRGLEIGGHQDQGNATGTATVGILIQNPSFNFNSYFNFLETLLFSNVNYGIELRHQANANFISNIMTERTGNNDNTTGGAAIFINGSQENMINNVFVHAASNTYGLQVSSSDNSANGGGIMQPRYNKISNFIAEPGGSNAKTLNFDATGGTNNYFVMGDNAPSGNSLTADFYENNNSIMDQFLTAERVQVTRLKYISGGELTISGGAITITSSKHTVDTQGEAATDDLVTINGGIDGQQLIITTENSSRTVVVKDGTGNLRLDGDFTMDHTQDVLVLLYSQPNWIEIARSDNNT